MDNSTQTLSVEAPASSTRIKAIDRLRGICIFFVIGSFLLGLLEDFWPGFEKLVPFFAHASDGGYQLLPNIAFADLFAPMFIFVIGLTFVKSFRSRERIYGTKKAFFQMAVRYLGLMGIGALLNGIEDGYADLFSGDKWADLDKNIRVFMVGVVLVIAILIVVIVAQFCKSKKFKDISAAILRYTLAFFGLCVLFFMICSLGEKVGGWTGSQLVYEGNKYGGWIWDTLQNIGWAGLVALPFVTFDKWSRFILACIGFLGLTIFYQHNGFELSRTILEGGLIGGITWGGIILVGSFFMELQEEKSNLYWIIPLVMLSVALVLILRFNYITGKRGCTPTYALVTISVSAFAFKALTYLEKWSPKFGFFEIWGGSSIMTYTIGYVLCLILGMIFETTKASIATWLAILIAVVVFALFTVMNWLLSRKSKHIRL